MTWWASRSRISPDPDRIGTHYRPPWPAMITRLISEVPWKISNLRASRQFRSNGNALLKP